MCLAFQFRKDIRTELLGWTTVLESSLFTCESALLRVYEPAFGPVVVTVSPLICI